MGDFKKHISCRLISRGKNDLQGNTLGKNSCIEKKKLSTSCLWSITPSLAVFIFIRVLDDLKKRVCKHVTYWLPV